MSRVIVKNLPKHLSDDRFREHFQKFSPITDAKLMKTSRGTSRRFGYIGYATEGDAKRAAEYFANSFIDTSRIIVEIAKAYGDPSLARPWSAYSAGSYLHQQKQAAEEKRKVEAENTLKRKQEELVSEEMHKKRAHINALYGLDVDPAKKEKLQEFLSVMESRPSSRVWSNDDETLRGASAETAPKKVQAVVSSVQNRKAGGQGILLAKTHVKFEDDEDDELYDDMPQSKDAVPDIEEDEELANIDDIDDLPEMASEDENDGTKVESASAAEPEAASMPSPIAGLPAFEAMPPAQAIAETGRLFVRNLTFDCKESDLKKAFAPFGPISELHIPIDPETKKSKGVAYVLYLMPEHAVKAFRALDGSCFQGRLIHILPGKDKPTSSLDENAAIYGSKVKLERAKRKRALAKSEFNWNSLYMNVSFTRQRRFFFGRCLTLFQCIFC